MKIIFTVTLLVLFFLELQGQTFLPDLKFSEGQSGLRNISNPDNLKSPVRYKVQPKKRKTVNAYVGAGYSFVIFTSSDMNSAYPVFDTRKGDFLSEINLYFGFAVSQAVTFEFEPSILFTNSEKQHPFDFGEEGINKKNNNYRYVFATALGLLSFPLALNVRFFPLYRQTNSFVRLFFVGGGIGGAWIREEYDNYYSNDPSGFFAEYFETESTSQWQPLFRIMTGFTGTGGQFGFGGELRYNIIPLSQERQPFVTRIAENFNSVDLTLRFYFSL